MSKTTKPTQLDLFQADDKAKAAEAQLASAIELVPIDNLKPSPQNPRTHSRSQRRKIKKSIQKFGFTAPILIDENDRILAGHGRLEAAKLLGLAAVPCIRLTYMSEAQKRAYLIADNRLAQLAGWDDDLLAEEIEALMGLEPSFDLTLTGFSIPEIDGLIANNKPEKPGNPDDDRLPDAQPLLP